MSDIESLERRAYRGAAPQPAMSEQARKYPERAVVRQQATIRPEFFMAIPANVATTVRYDVVTIIDYRGVAYFQDPEHEHEPVGDVGAYALVWKLGRPLWRGYSDGWEAIRAMDAIQSGVFDTGGIGECSPDAVVDHEGHVRWVRP